VYTACIFVPGQQPLKFTTPNQNSNVNMESAAPHSLTSYSSLMLTSARLSTRKVTASNLSL